MLIICVCGCNKQLEEFDNKNRKRSFIHGHNNRGEKHWNWKGENIKYGGIHDWITARMGQPQCCDECGSLKKKKYEWANISGKYLREITDWRRLCTSCHRKYDNAKKI